MPAPRDQFQWTEDAVERLRRRWAEGVSTAAIGRELGVSKNAVIGKARRLRLANRPSPIRPAKPKPDPGPPPRPVPPSRPVRLLPPGPAAAEPDRRLAAMPAGAADAAPCRWPIGEPGTAGFRFCDAAALGGKPYCAAHCAIAYGRQPATDDRAHRRPAR